MLGGAVELLLLAAVVDALGREGLLLGGGGGGGMSLIVSSYVDVVVLRDAHVAVGGLRAFTLIEFVIFRYVIVYAIV